MCNNAVCGQHPGEVEFRAYQQRLGPEEVIFKQEEQPGACRYGVVINTAAWQWEIVAVEASRRRHVAFVSPQYCLNQVLDLASGWARSMAAVMHQTGPAMKTALDVGQAL